MSDKTAIRGSTTPKSCFKVWRNATSEAVIFSDESDSATVYDNCASASSPYESAIGEEYEEAPRPRPPTCLSEDSTPDEPDVHFSKKFLNVFMSGRSRSSSEWAAGSCRGSWGGVPGRRPQVHLVTALGLSRGLGRSSPSLSLSPTGAESFGLFSCVINGEEQEQTHRAIFR